MTGKPSGYQYLTSILSLACAVTLAVSLPAFAAEVNNGTIEYTNPGNTHNAPDGYENRGDLTATSTDPGAALSISSGGFTNYGTITASSDGSLGYGISVSSGGFANYGTITASGSNSYGINVSNGGFANHGNITASGSGSSGYGIRVNNGGFTNYGLLTLAGTGTSIYMSNNSGNNMRLLPGSVLALGGGHIDMGGANPSLYSQPGVQVLSLAAAAGDRTSRVPIFRGLQSLNGSSIFGSTDLAVALNLNQGNGPILGYNAISAGGNDYDIVVLRYANASDFVGDNAGGFMSELENALNGQSLDALTGPLYDYALLRSYIDSQSTVQGVQATAEKAAREHTPQGTANSTVMLTRNARIAQQILSDRLQAVGNLNSTSSAPGTGDASYGLYFFGQPFYHHGELDGKSGYSDLTENVFGGSIGVMKAVGPWVFGLSGHTFRSDIDGGGNTYDADATGYGVNLGLGRSFCVGPLKPFVELTGGWTFVEMDQTRRTSMMLPGLGGDSYDSTVDMNIYTASLTVSNRFAFDTFSITPRLGVDYAYTDMDSYSEGNGVLALDVDGNDFTSLRSIAGLTLGYSPLPSLHLEARADYYHEFADTEISLTSRFRGTPVSITTQSQDTGRDSFRVGAGLSWTPTDCLSLSLNYDYTGAKSYQGHDVAVQVRLEF